jgi:Raf kinase inhibitor-like YbhB/YbcL family protein
MKKILLGLLLISVGGAVMAQQKSLFKLTSSAFANSQPIPRKYTCQGESVSPQLAWSGAPARTQSFALIVDDPDAPNGKVEPYVHWVLFNIPANVTELKEGEAQGINGQTSAGTSNYVGMCPPSGNHRYFFKLYALDTMLDLQQGTTKKQLETAMKEHILAQATLMGTYQQS